MPKYDVTVIGTVCCDIIFHGLPSFPKLGEEIWTKGVEVTAGGAINTPAALSRLGLEVGLATPLGNDFFGQYILSKIKEEGILTDLIQFIDGPFPQVSVSLNYDDDRAFVSYAEKEEKGSHRKHLCNVVENSDTQLFHFYTSCEKGHTELVRKAKESGKLVSLDSGWHPEWLRSKGIREQIRLADVFLPNLKEAQVITGKQDAYEVLNELSTLTSTVIIKMGEKGAIGKSDGKVYKTKAMNVKPIDSTGAGDCFVAGFLYGWLKGLDMDRCIEIANYCGGLAVTAVGGFSGAPSVDELPKYLVDEVQKI